MQVVEKTDDASEGYIKIDSDYPTYCGGLQINLPIKSTVSSLKIEIRGFNDLNVVCLTRIMRQYENQLWMKGKSNKRVVFKCLFCEKLLYHFCSLKCHLFNHLEIFPFKCFACNKTYTSNKALGKHTKAKHND